jgi:hypothetical protein
VRLYQQGEGLLDIRSPLPRVQHHAARRITAEAAPHALADPHVVEVAAGRAKSPNPGKLGDRTLRRSHHLRHPLFVIYDPIQQQMIAGNYDGVWRWKRGSAIPIPPDLYATSTANGQPIVTSPIP